MTDPEPVLIDLIEIVCANCLETLETIVPVPDDLFACPRCGAVLRAEVKMIIERVSTSVVLDPSPVDGDDITPVASPIPLRRAKTIS